MTYKVYQGAYNQECYPSGQSCWHVYFAFSENHPTLIRNKHPSPKKKYNFLESAQLYFRLYIIYSSVSFYLLVDCMTVHNNFNFTGHKQRCCIIRGIKHCLLWLQGFCMQHIYKYTGTLYIYICIKQGSTTCTWKKQAKHTSMISI